ncbi:uncharacterized protein LOC113226692 [Hyposmocoma kahamanoa]|uniref:uncharacterized protein LOC113226692 n=1 Tax=Hyposmocoma kahamanoa TaxID=1477025 RepID=UPI000E6D90A0|nr:uncharacterized protein LOC113226692 [Hyposmocoma kahamanoa]
MWKCPECLNSRPKSDNTNTPIKPVAPISLDCADNNITLRSRPTTTTQGSDSSPAPGPLFTTESSQFELVSELRLLREEMKASRSEMKQFRSAVAELTAALSMANQRIDELSTRVDVLERQPREATNGNVSVLEQTIESLKLDLNDRDQEMLCNDIEVAGVPEEKNESTVHLVLSLSAKLGIKLEERDIVSAERVGGVRRAVVGEDAAVRSRPRPLVVRLVRRSSRDQLLTAARVRRGATTADMGMASAARLFYVNERLTRYNRQLFYRARAEGTSAQWKYVWTRGGSIYARKEHGAPRYRLRSEHDISKVFCRLSC